MDLDIYEIDNYVAVGDTNATIRLSSSQDFIMINTVITKLNSQLPDATIIINNPILTCDSREVTFDYTVSNFNSTEVLQANTPITFYADSEAVATIYTQNSIPIGGIESSSTSLLIPPNIPSNFRLTAVVDDIGNGTGIVRELIENNNSSQIEVELIVSPTFNVLEDIKSCNLGFSRGIFDFSNYEDLIKTDPNDTVSFYESNSNAITGIYPLIDISSYETQTTPKEIFVRIENQNCYAISSFNLTTRNCPPTVYNAVSANGDGLNDTFFIEGLRDIFVNFKLEIYNRWGKHLWTGTNNKENWDGTVEHGIGNYKAPDGTYFYLLYLNDPDYPETLVGYLYIAQ
jgi:gliding motility-associated-like protein